MSGKERERERNVKTFVRSVRWRHPRPCRLITHAGVSEGGKRVSEPRVMSLSRGEVNEEDGEDAGWRCKDNG